MAQLHPETPKKLRGLYPFWLLEPRRLAMHEWGAVFDPKKPSIKSALAGHLDVDLNLGSNDMPPCGTVGCIAGTIVLLNTPKHELDRLHEKAVAKAARFVNQQKEDEYGEVDSDDAFVWLDDADNKGRRLLRLNSEQADRLFVPSSWPEPFSEMYGEADTPLQRVKATIRRIEFFILTDGTDEFDQIVVPTFKIKKAAKKAKTKKR